MATNADSMDNKIIKTTWHIQF